MVQRDTFYMILLVMNSLFLEMLYFMKLFFLFLRKISVTSTCTPNFDKDGQNLEPLTLLPTDIMPNNSPTPNDITPTPAPIRQSTRIKHKPTYLQDYHCNLLTSSHPFIHQNQSTVFPLSSVLSYEKCNPPYKIFCLSISSIIEPKTFTQASKHNCWVTAMQEEIDALNATNTWSIVDLPEGKIPIGCK